MIHRCPECGSDKPFFSLYRLHLRVWKRAHWWSLRKSWVTVDGGDIVACQSCPHVYAVGPDGVFKRYSHSIPNVERSAPIRAVSNEPADDRDPDVPERPLPRMRPRV